MPDLTAPQASELAAAADAAAVLPSQRAAVPVLCRMAALDPVTGRAANTAELLALLKGEEAVLRAAFEVAGRMLAGDTRPDGQVVSVGNASGNPMMLLAAGVVQSSLNGEPEQAWAQVQQYPPARRVALLSVLVCWLNYHFAGLGPVALAVQE
ncbi:hypothetical protein [Streptomyces sp. NPDC001787]|uniref:hypothetical protein n=1 Tax=Streptomyces sp. NPDC001787 TaxID=3154523 RepID=UPI003324ECCF